MCTCSAPILSAWEEYQKLSLFEASAPSSTPILPSVVSLLSSFSWSSCAITCGARRDGILLHLSLLLRLIRLAECGCASDALHMLFRDDTSNLAVQLVREQALTSALFTRTFSAFLTNTHICFPYPSAHSPFPQIQLLFITDKQISFQASRVIECWPLFTVRTFLIAESFEATLFHSLIHPSIHRNMQAYTHARTHTHTHAHARTHAFLHSCIVMNACVSFFAHLCFSLSLFSDITSSC